MPVISMFYGIIIRMFSESGERHHIPHIHCIYNEYEATITFDGMIIEGHFPQSKLKLVQAWIEIHRDELVANWDLLSQGEQHFRIEPLKELGELMLRPTVTAVSALPDYQLKLIFDNGEIRIFDVKPYIKGAWFGALSDPAYFCEVSANGYSIEWKDGQDICPDELYYNSAPASACE